MSALPKDGGPAFPTHWTEVVPGIGAKSAELGGMSLRDWFAGQSLVGLVSSFPEMLPQDRVRASTIAYTIADAMLKAREAKP